MKIPYTFLFAIGCCSLVASNDCLAQSADKPTRKPAASAEESKDKDKGKGEEQTQVNVDENSILGRMAKAVQGYYAAKSPKEKLQFVVSPDKTEPLMRDYYFREPLVPGILKEMSNPEAVAVNGLSYWRTNVALQDGRQGTVFLKLVDETPKVDWPSEVHYSTISWDEWLKKEDGKVADFRVFAQLDNYYPQQFSDRSKYLCIKVSSSDSPHTIFAYLKLQDADQLEFAQALADGQSRDCVLSLKLREKGDEKFETAEVEKVVSPTWLVTEGGK